MTVAAPRAAATTIRAWPPTNRLTPRRTSSRWARRSSTSTLPWPSSLWPRRLKPTKVSPWAAT
jgi:hypothetical protein